MKSAETFSAFDRHKQGLRFEGVAVGGATLDRFDIVVDLDKRLGHAL